MLTENPDGVGQSLRSTIEKYAQGTVSQTFDELFDYDNAMRISHNPSFKQNSGDFIDGSEPDKFKAEWERPNDYKVTHAASIFALENPESESSTNSQTGALLEITGLVNGDTSNLRSIGAPSAMMDACQRVTVLVSATQCHEVYLVGFAGRDDELIKGGRVTEEVRKELETVLIDAQTGWGRDSVSYYRLDSTKFYWNSREIDISTHNPFVENWKNYVDDSVALQNALNGKQKIGFFSVIKQSKDASGNSTYQPNVATTIQQLEILAESMSVTAEKTFLASESNRDVFPSNCNVITFVVVDPAPAVIVVTPSIEKDVKFTAANEVVRDEAFEAIIADYVRTDTKITEIEVFAEDDSAESRKKADAQARALKKALQEEGISNRMAKVMTKVPTPAEKSSPIKMRIKTK